MNDTVEETANVLVELSGQDQTRPPSTAAARTMTTPGVTENVQTFTLTPTQYGSWKLPSGQEFIINEKDELVPIASAKQNMPVVNYSANLNPLETFNASTDWDIYRERLEQYFHASHIGHENQMSALITAIRLDVYKTLRDLCHPVLPQNKNYEELCGILKRHFSIQISTFKERRNFYRLRQEQNENVSQ